MYTHCLKNVHLEYVCINGPLAQSVERGSNNASVGQFHTHSDQISSLFIWITFSF